MTCGFDSRSKNAIIRFARRNRLAQLYLDRKRGMP
jgi:hypothetical protein